MKNLDFIEFIDNFHQKIHSIVTFTGNFKMAR